MNAITFQSLSTSPLSDALGLTERALLIYFNEEFPHLTLEFRPDDQTWQVVKNGEVLSFNGKTSLTRSQVQTLMFILDEKKADPSKTVFEFVINDYKKGEDPMSYYTGIGHDVQQAFKQAGLTRGHFLAMDHYRLVTHFTEE